MYVQGRVSNLNGLYLHGETDQCATGVIWYSLKFTYMKIRRAGHFGAAVLVPPFRRQRLGNDRFSAGTCQRRSLQRWRCMRRKR